MPVASAISLPPFPARLREKVAQRNVPDYLQPPLVPLLQPARHLHTTLRQLPRPSDPPPRPTAPAMAAAPLQSIFPDSYVGFDSITKQIEKKSVKRGFQFNVICVGEQLETLCARES